MVIKGISGKEAALEENFVISKGAMASVATNALMAATANNVTGKIHITENSSTNEIRFAVNKRKHKFNNTRPGLILRLL